MPQVDHCKIGVEWKEREREPCPYRIQVTFDVGRRVRVYGTEVDDDEEVHWYNHKGASWPISISAILGYILINDNSQNNFKKKFQRKSGIFRLLLWRFNDLKRKKAHCAMRDLLKTKNAIEIIMEINIFLAHTVRKMRFIRLGGLSPNVPFERLITFEGICRSKPNLVSAFHIQNIHSFGIKLHNNILNHSRHWVKIIEKNSNLVNHYKLLMFASSKIYKYCIDRRSLNIIELCIVWGRKNVSISDS